MPALDFSWHRDWVAVAALIPARELREGITLLVDAALRPTFDKAVLERKREQGAVAADQQVDSVLADRVMRRVLFGSHAYAAGLVSPARTRAVKPADAASLHARLFDASRLSVAVAGGADVEEVVAALEDALGSAPRRGGRAPTPATPRESKGPRLVVVDRPGVTVATIAMGALGPVIGSPDVGAAWLDLDLLADSAFGRITHRLRDKLPSPPYVSWACSWMRLAGEIGWQVRVPTDAVAPALVETEAVLRELAAKGPADDELADVRSRRTLAFASWFELAAGTAKELSLHTIYQLPEDALTRTPQRFASVGVAEAKAAAVRYFDADRVRTVIVGDYAKLAAPLTALGWGTIEVRDAEGAVKTGVAGTRK
jgi:predicted Zn-dependent peptidase